MRCWQRTTFCRSVRDCGGRASLFAVFTWPRVRAPLTSPRPYAPANHRFYTAGGGKNYLGFDKQFLNNLCVGRVALLCTVVAARVNRAGTLAGTLPTPP